MRSRSFRLLDSMRFLIWSTAASLGSIFSLSSRDSLISTILFDSLERDSFSFVEFYSRRIRRIFPGLIVILAAALTAGWFLLLADEYKQFGSHLAGGAGFISNLILWKESGYFDNAAETKPLLHLWSLGIEEQFYIIWPLLLWAGWRRKLNLLAITSIVAILSFAWNMIAAYRDSVADFYSPQTRFWELLIGAGLAYAALHQKSWFAQYEPPVKKGGRRPKPPPARLLGSVRLANLQSVLGATLIAVSLFYVTRDKAFPGWWGRAADCGRRSAYLRRSARMAESDRPFEDALSSCGAD